MEKIYYKKKDYRIIGYHLDSLYMVQGYISMKDTWYNIVGYDNLTVAIAKITSLIKENNNV